jgi:acyl-CoA synthetase (AMP-forming)/AMP-acid ligase II
VYGVDNRTLGQEVKAVVVLRPGVGTTADDLIAFCAETLAYYKVPSIVEVREDRLPRNATGKVVKGVLRGEVDNVYEE